MAIELNRTGDAALRALAADEPTPSQSLLAVANVKALARIDDDDEDQLLAELCRVVETTIEGHSGLAVRRGRWQAIIENPGPRVVLPGPVLATSDIVSVSVRDRAGEGWRVVPAAANFEARIRGSHPGRPLVVDLLAPSPWLRVTYDRGWSYHPDRPADLRHAGAQLIGELLSNREGTADVRSFMAAPGLPVAVSAVLSRYRIGGAR